MSITITGIQNDSTRGLNVLIKKGDGHDVRVYNGQLLNLEVSWQMPMWSSGQRMIIYNNGPIIWLVVRDNFILVSHDEGETWVNMKAIEHGQSFTMIIADNGVTFLQNEGMGDDDDEQLPSALAMMHVTQKPFDSGASGISTDAASSPTPVLLRPRNFQWYWNSAADPWSSDVREEWTKFTDVENEIIEDALNLRKEKVEIDDGYCIDFKHNIQYNQHDQQKQRPIKRLKLETDRSNVHLREERFSFPISLVAASTSPPSTNAEDKCHFQQVLHGPDFSETYYYHVLESKHNTLADVVEDAAKGIMKEGIALGKPREAEWLAEQLLTVKHYGASIKSDRRHTAIPDEIGQTCVYLYTKESFWYKLMNKTLRSLCETITHDQLNTLGPFCYLLSKYLHQNKTAGILIVYRGLNLTDEERKEFMIRYKALIFSSFTSTSTNREKAERFGNTLFIINLNVKHSWGEGKLKISCGANISALSDFQDEEEFLIWPATTFYFVQYQYDNVKKKHIVFLKSSSINTG